ncbi:MAG TPA: EAL domain-containing protein, partial [Vicinamibacterales bacterium]
NFDVDAEVESYAASIAEQREFARIRALPNGRSVLISCRPSLDGGWVDVHEDVTDRIESDQTIERLAHSDLLTGLMNRHKFIKTLSTRVTNVGESPKFAVVLVDIPNFKRVNDTYGHETGDQVLKVVAERLQGLAGTDDGLARMEGDGFAMIRAQADAAAAAVFAAQVCSVASQAIEIDGQSIDIGVNAGVALSPDHGDTAGELLQRAELALNQSKAATDRGFALFDADHEISVREHEALKNDLKLAFELGQFELHYQPIMDYKTRQITSVEALMRWRHPTRGSVSPSVFISIAEETGLLNELGKWAIGRACTDALAWPSHVRVAVNLSANQFRQGDLHTITHAALRASGLPPRRLEFEVTESLLLSDELRTRRTLNRLKAMGIRIALDDFGTGYASLSYLRSFPFDKIKIDQTFVRDLPRDADCNAIVRSVVLLARMLGMRTVAEGIETVDHLSQVVAAGCDEIQGYYLSRPVPATAVPDIIADCECRLTEAA